MTPHPSAVCAASPTVFQGQTSGNTAKPSLLRRGWRVVKGVVIFVIVVFHLLLFVVRNPLDLWYKPIKSWMEQAGYWEDYGKEFKWVDNFTWKYANFVGCEQGWGMFSPQLARGAPFLAFRYEFTDGSSEQTYSANEPELSGFFRIGGWQIRKLEDYLAYPPEDLATNDERPLWEAYARHAIRRWQRAHPDDGRQLRRVVFVRRRINFPEPEEDPAEYDLPTEKNVATFDAAGRLVP
jgi:hypothetical protein